MNLIYNKIISKNTHAFHIIRLIIFEKIKGSIQYLRCRFSIVRASKGETKNHKFAAVQKPGFYRFKFKKIFQPHVILMRIFSSAFYPLRNFSSAYLVKGKFILLLNCPLDA